MSRSSPRSPQPAWLEHLIVLGSFLILALVTSYPLVTDLAQRIPGVDGDVWSYLWAMGWARSALLNLGVNPFHTDYIFYPLGGATQLLWGTALPSFASLPLQLAFGLVPAFNLVYLAASVLTGYGMYLLGREVLPKPAKTAAGVHLAAWLSGCIFAFGALRLGYGLAFVNLFHTEFIPFYVLFLVRATRTRGWQAAILAGIFFAFNVYIDFQIAAFLAVLTGLWFLYQFARVGWRAYRARTRQDATTTPALPSFALRQWLVMLLVAGALALPMLGLVLQDFAIEGGNYIRVYPLRYSEARSYDLLSFVLPNARSTLYSAVPTPRVEGVNVSVTTPDDSEMSPDRQAFLGYGVLALALLGILTAARRMAFWFFATLFFLALSLGPVLHIAGMNTGLPMPFTLANLVPILNHVRIPMRFGLMVFFGVALLAGAGAHALIRWRRWTAGVLAVLVVAEAVVLPFPTLEFRVPSVYEQIAREPGDFTVLEIPSFNWRAAARNEAYQAIHQKRLLRAYTNRISPDLADYFNLRQTPIVVRSLRILEGAEEGILTEDERAEDRSVTAETLDFFKLRYAILHRDQLQPAQADEIDAYLREVLGATVVSRDGAVTAYRLPDAPPAAPHQQLDLADNTSLMYLGRGWQTEPLADAGGSSGRYLTSGRSELYIPLSDTSASELTWEGMPQGAALDVNLNGHALGAVRQTEDGWGAYTAALPSDRLQAGMNRLQWTFDAALSRILAIRGVEWSRAALSNP